MPISSRKHFLSSFEELIQDMEECDDVDLRGSLRLADKKVRVPTPALPLQLLLGGEDGYRLHLDPEVAIDADGHFHPTGDYLLFDPTSYFNGISGFIRLTTGNSVTLGRRDLLQRLLLDFPKVVEDKHLRLKLNDNGLALKKKSSKQGACVGPITDRDMFDRMSRWRRRKIERLAKVLGSPIECPSRSEAQALIERVIACMENEPYRVRADDGRPGGLLRLPGRPAPIFVGDLHARIDNLLVILTQNGFLEALQDGSGMLILVGDAVHPDEPGMEEEMDMSMLLMDLIFRLKLLFPGRVFYLRGNHDSFAEDISKGGVPQGLLWEKALHDRRGPGYRDSMQRIYDLMPYVAVSHQFVACHAGAPTMKVSQEDLIHVHDNPALQYQLTHLRLRKPNSPSGYSRAHVARLRRRLGVPPDAAFVVGHTPLSSEDTYWLNAGGIEHHHVLFGANPNTVGVITRPKQHLLPLKYPVEPLLAVYNRLVHTGKMTL
jgi:hypothetical protein